MAIKGERRGFTRRELGLGLGLLGAGFLAGRFVTELPPSKDSGISRLPEKDVKYPLEHVFQGLRHLEELASEVEPESLKLQNIVVIDNASEEALGSITQMIGKDNVLYSGANAIAQDHGEKMVRAYSSEQGWFGDYFPRTWKPRFKTYYINGGGKLFTSGTESDEYRTQILGILNNLDTPIINISMSYAPLGNGLPEYREGSEFFFQKLKEAGLVYIASSGNEGNITKAPASLAGAVCAGAILAGGMISDKFTGCAQGDPNRVRIGTYPSFHTVDGDGKSWYNDGTSYSVPAIASALAVTSALYRVTPQEGLYKVVRLIEKYKPLLSQQTDEFHPLIPNYYYHSLAEEMTKPFQRLDRFVAGRIEANR